MDIKGSRSAKGPVRQENVGRMSTRVWHQIRRSIGVTKSSRLCSTVYHIADSVMTKYGHYFLRDLFGGLQTCQLPGGIEGKGRNYCGHPASRRDWSEFLYRGCGGQDRGRRPHCSSQWHGGVQQRELISLSRMWRPRQEEETKLFQSMAWGRQAERVRAHDLVVGAEKQYAQQRHIVQLVSKFL